MTTTDTDRHTTTEQVYQIVIKASPEQIWDAITKPEFTRHYFHGARITVTQDRYHSLGPDDSVWDDGAVLEWDPPHRVVHEWRSLYDEAAGAEPASRVSWEITARANGTCLLTAVHDLLEQSPRTAEAVSGAGWMGVLSALKTLLETGEELPLS
ncbi:SRPBCC domain-containing protein [Leekyejoonella antrihumi]|uniref:ATPase n=1 Tax=Leekyejoonella antrihumi TaxID=1660198 RepID=A0A563DWK9_9MICO|nr:SRPBCC domain-containing protein [Leekyejoonella antrihumi]TWP34606.1 ATPase [Leekyejoonella antrihumi]